MEEIATQPATQPQLDARRTGTYSMNENDESDVICILHPSSPAALQAIGLVVKQCPQHILQNEGLEKNIEYGNDEKATPWLHERTRPDPGSQESPAEGINPEDSLNDDLFDEDPAAPAASSKDIALRLSSMVRNACLGFTFGRNPSKCDIPLASKNEQMEISNSHFRIYINSGGILMLEDTSTNGTYVDGFELRAKSEDPKILSRRTLSQGSMIALAYHVPSDPIRFVVGIPTRHRHGDAYEER